MAPEVRAVAPGGPSWPGLAGPGSAPARAVLPRAGAAARLLLRVRFLIRRGAFLHAFLTSVCFCFASLSDFPWEVLLTGLKNNQRCAVLLFSKVLSVAFVVNL